MSSLATKKLAEEIMLEVKENSKKLKSCIRHDFTIDLTPDSMFDKKYQCTRCGGTIDGIERYWYLKGLEHGITSKGVKRK